MEAAAGQLQVGAADRESVLLVGQTAVDRVFLEARTAFDLAVGVQVVADPAVRVTHSV